MATEITWLGHNAWSIHTPRGKVLVDPFLTDNPVAAAKADHVEADYILVSHGHADHVGDVAAIANRTRATVVANFEICEWLSSKHGVSRSEPMNLGGVIELPFGYVRMTLAFHSSTLPDGSNGGSPAGFYLTLDDGNVYFACDTAVFSDMRIIGSYGIDLAVLPIGDRFTMGPQDSIQAINLLAPGRVAPCHYNTWPIIKQNVEGWAALVRENTSAEPLVLQPGGKIQL